MNLYYLAGIIINIIVVILAIFKLYNSLVIKFMELEKTIEHRITKSEVNIERLTKDVDCLYNNYRNLKEV